MESGERGECFGAGELSTLVTRVAKDSSTTAHCKHQALQVASTKQRHCANDFMMDSSISLFIKKILCMHDYRILNREGPLHSRLHNYLKC